MWVSPQRYIQGLWCCNFKTTLTQLTHFLQKLHQMRHGSSLDIYHALIKHSCFRANAQVGTVTILCLSRRHVKCWNGSIHSLPEVCIGDPSIVGLKPQSATCSLKIAKSCKGYKGRWKMLSFLSLLRFWIVQVLKRLKVCIFILASQNLHLENADLPSSAAIY